MLLTGVVSGIIAGLLGVGGGIVIVPVLEAVLAFLGVDVAVRMHIAVATSLAVIIPTSLSSARAHGRRDSIDYAIVRSWAPFIFLGVISGVVISAYVSGRFLAGVFAAVAFLLSINMIAHFTERRLGEDLPKTPFFLSLPFSIGSISTLMGIGGGSMTVPALTVFGKPIHLAVGTSALLGLVIAVPSAAGYIVTGWGNPSLPDGSIGYINLYGFALITPMSVFCAPLGARIAHAMSQRLLGGFFGLFLLAMSVRMGLLAI